MKNLLVFFGGVSCERDVSTITGAMTVNALSRKYNTIPVFIDQNGRWRTGEVLKNLAWYKTRDYKQTEEVAMIPGDSSLYKVKNGKLKFAFKCDAAINCLHGVCGEDGTISGLMKLCGTPFASPSVFASSVSMDKHYTKIALKGIDVKTLPYVKLRRENFYDREQFAVRYVQSFLDFPVIVKPANLGSSIGVSAARNKDELVDALYLAFRYDGKAIVEKALENFREINCACTRVGNRILSSECEEPILSGEILRFEDKYSSEKRATFPANIDANLSKKIRETTEYIYRKLEFDGVIRIDYLVLGDEVYVNEINSVPGSLAYYLFSESLEEFSDILSRTIEDAIERHNASLSDERFYSSNILNLDSGKIRKGGGRA